jgi:hypothetical protein
MEHSGIDLVVVKGASVLARFQLRTDIVERFFSVLKDMPSILALAPMRGKIGRHILCFSRTRGLNNIGFAMLNGHAISHTEFSSASMDLGQRDVPATPGL